MVGGMATYSELLRHGLEEEGIDVVIDDTGWIPNETGWKVDRKVSKQLQEASRGFDLIHAFGYRAAWACSEAFYLKRPWVYTAYDMPKTLVSQLIDRLNAARTGIVPTRKVKQKLEEADTLNLEVVMPCVHVPNDLPSMQDCKSKLGLNEEHPLILGMGPFGKDRGFRPLSDAADQLKFEYPDVQVAMVGEEPGSVSAAS